MHRRSLGRSERGERGGFFGKTTKRRRRRGLLVVCLLRLLMAVLGRLRNWRVCTRSLYTASLFLSPFTSFFDFFLFWFLPPPLRPPSRLSPLLFSRDDGVSFLFPSSRLTCHPLRMFSQARWRVASRRLSSSLTAILLRLSSRLPLVNTHSRFEKATRSRVSLKSLPVAIPPMIFRRLAVWLRSSFSTRARSNSVISNPAFQTLDYCDSYK